MQANMLIKRGLAVVFIGALTLGPAACGDDDSSGGGSNGGRGGVDLDTKTSVSTDVGGKGDDSGGDDDDSGY